MLAQPAFRDRHLTPKGYEPSGLGPPALADHIRRELASRAELVKLSGITAQE